MNNNKNTKTIIHVWTQEFLELDERKSKEYFGFGDLIRCSIELYKLCKCMNYNFILDISLHPISQFYNQYKHEHSELILENKDEIYHISSYNMVRYISKKIKEKDVLYFICNFGSSVSEPKFGETEIETKERIDYFKKIFTPNKEFMNYINENYKDILKTEYSILHYRFEDNYLLNKCKDNFDKFYNHVIKNYDNNYIFMCDSYEFKKYIKNKDKNIKLIDNDVCHIGKCKNKDLLRYTLSELYIVSKSNYIKSFSVLYWVSGFVNHISKLYDIPIDGNINVKY
jgi:hypothetical protein